MAYRGNFTYIGGSGFPEYESSSRGYGGGLGSQPTINNTKHYETLGIGKDASQADIKKAYINAAKIHHPDKGGNADKFNEVQQAYETLNDPEKRKNYDTYGDKPQTEDIDMDTADLLSMLFGGRRFAGRTSTTTTNNRPKEKEKVKPIKKIIHATLEDVYNGHVFKVPHKRQRNCAACDGMGGQRETKCMACRGAGSYTKLTQLGSGVYTQSKTLCTECRGKGVMVDRTDICSQCLGMKFTTVEKVLEVPVDKGAPNQHEILLSGEGDEQPGCLAGDIIMILDISHHEQFERIGADLYFKKKITLLQALTGVKTAILHLDGNLVNVQTKPGDIISNGQRRTIPGLGMPFFGNSMNHGNLIVEFIVEMPQPYSLPPEVCQKLAQLLPGRENQRMVPNRQSTMMQEYRESDLNTNPEGGNQPKPSYGSYESYGRSANPGCSAQ